MGKKGAAIIFLTACLLLVTLLSPRGSWADEPSSEQQNLEKYLTVEASLLGVNGDVSLYFKNLSNNTEVAMSPSRSWIPASTIKVFVMLEAFRQRRLGLIDFDQNVIVDPENVVPTAIETDEFTTLLEGTRVPIGQLVKMMIIQSDNTAYNTLLDVLDRRNINLTLRTLGITQTTVGEKLNIDDNQLAKDLQVPGRQNNTITAKDFFTFFDLLYHHQVPDTDEMLAILKKQKLNEMIPSLLPADTAVAHKTGEWAPIFHDGGVIYKPNDPFILAVMTNDNDPGVVAKMARVAYFRDADSVVGSLTAKKPVSYAPSQGRDIRIYLAEAAEQSVSNVLAEATASAASAKFPEITAADLGITRADLALETKGTEKISSAVIMPGTGLYSVKKWWEGVLLQLPMSEDMRIGVLLNSSRARLSEAKVFLSGGKTSEASISLDQSLANLKSAVALTEKVPDKDLQLYKIGQVSSIHFATLAGRASDLSRSSKEEKERFVNLVYNFYQRDKKEVQAVVAASQVANPLQRKPIIGTVAAKGVGTVTLKFDDGKTAQVEVNDLTPIRPFGSSIAEGKGAIGLGTKLAIVGQLDNRGRIIPQFILDKVPANLPNKHEGKVVDIEPAKNLMKIRDRLGSILDVVIGPQTTIRSRDTDVALEGVKAGSTVTVFGEEGPVATPAGGVSTIQPGQPTPAPSGKTGAPSGQAGGGEETGKAGGAGPGKAAPSTLGPAATVQVKATTITVTTNASGKHEKTEKPKKTEERKK